MKLVICDDEKICIDDVMQHLEFFSDEKSIDFEISIFQTSTDLINENKKYDIAILDVEIDNMNGLKLGEHLRKINPHIVLIYITAYKKYLDDALNLNAVRFFEKPIDSQRFYRGLSAAIARIDNSTIEFYLKDGKTIERINAQDIIYVEIEKRKSRIVIIGKEYHSNRHISYWRDSLNSTVFISPHKSYIINFNYVTAYERNQIVLNNKYQIQIARNRQTSFYQQFMRFMEGK